MVLHLGARVNHLLPYTQLKRDNVTAVRHVLQFCTQKDRPAALHFVSSLVVFEHTTAQVSEATPLAHQGLSAARGYDQSKWVADRMVERARQLGLRCVTHRPGFVGANSVTGESNPTDMDTRLVCGLIALRAHPRVDASVLYDASPVDWLASVIVASVYAAATPPVLHHKHPGQMVALREMIEWVRESGYTLAETSINQWRSLVATISEQSHPLYGLVDVLFPKSGMASRAMERYDCPATARFLRECRLSEAPALSKQWLGVWLEWLAASARIPPPTKRTAPSLAPVIRLRVCSEWCLSCGVCVCMFVCVLHSHSHTDRGQRADGEPRAPASPAQ